MKYILIALFSITSFANLSAQGIEFFHGSWEEALMEAKAQKKVIFVDAYAVWCGPCRRMANNVFTHTEVGKFYNQNFINLKLDMEKEEGMKFRQTYPVQAFPTLYYIDYTGEVIHQVRGAQDVQGFLRLGASALDMVDRSGSFAEAYESGDRSPELVYDYVKALNEAGKPSLRISNEYLRSQEDLESEQNLRFILEATVESDSRIFNMLIERRDAIEALVGKEAVRDRILFAASNTAQKAAEYKMESLLNDAQDAVKKHCSDAARQFRLDTDLEYYLAMRDEDNFYKAARAYAKKGKPDAAEFYRMSQDLWNYFGEESRYRKLAEQFAAEAAEVSDQYFVHLHYAYLLNENGKKSKAIEAARKALELAQEAGSGPAMQVEHFIEQLEG